MDWMKKLQGAAKIAVGAIAHRDAQKSNDAALADAATRCVEQGAFDLFEREVSVEAVQRMIAAIETEFAEVRAPITDHAFVEPPGEVPVDRCAAVVTEKCYCAPSPHARAHVCDKPRARHGS